MTFPQSCMLTAWSHLGLIYHTGKWSCKSELGISSGWEGLRVIICIHLTKITFLHMGMLSSTISVPITKIWDLILSVGRIKSYNVRNHVFVWDGDVNTDNWNRSNTNVSLIAHDIWPNKSSIHVSSPTISLVSFSQPSDICIYTHAQWSWWGIYWIYLVHPSVCQSFCPSLHPSVHW